MRSLLTLAHKARLFEMLYAFLSNDSMQSLRSILPLNSSMERLDNLWLLSVSAFELVEAGEVWLKIRSWDPQNSPYRKSVDRHQALYTSAR